MVGNLYGGVEWGVSLPMPSSWLNAGIRRLWYVEMWRLLREITKVVPAPVASVVGRRKHCNQGTGADANQHSGVGGRLAGHLSTVSV